MVTHGVRRAGSAAIDLAYVACGRLDAFWEFGLNPWDMAAGLCWCRSRRTFRTCGAALTQRIHAGGSRLSDEALSRRHFTDASVRCPISQTESDRGSSGS